MSSINFNLDSSNLDSSQESEKTSPELTQEQKNRMDANRKRALEIRENKEKTAKMAKIVLNNNNEFKKLLDTGAGFFLDEEELIEEEKKEFKVVEEPPVPTQDLHLKCTKCKKKFAFSFLSKNFDLNVCDTCKAEYPDDYDLITKTDAKEEYLLKDCDFDFREPVLKFITKKNPHKNRYGEMKLYLKCQVAERAFQVHETQEKLDEKKELRVLNLHKTRQKNYEKKLENLRKEARQGTKKLAEFHKHEYGEENYDEDEDKYFKICKTLERLILQPDWDQVLADKSEEPVWIQYKFSSEPALNAKLFFTKPSITATIKNNLNDNCFAIQKISNDNKEIIIKFEKENKELCRKFVAPVQKFRIHFDDKTKKPLPVLSLDVNNNGLGISSSQDGQLLLWLTQNGEIRRILHGHLGEVNVCKFFPSGLVVLSGADDLRLKVWSCEDASCPVTLTGHTRGISDFQIIEKGRNIVSVSRDGSCKLFDIGESKCLATVGQFDCIINCISLSSLTDSTIVHLNMPEHSEPLNKREIATENKILACACEDGYLRVLSLRARETIFEFKCESSVNCCCFLSETNIACGTQNGFIYLFNLIEKKSESWKEMRSTILSIQPLGNHNGFVATTGDGSCFAWNFNEANQVIELTGSDCDPVYKVVYNQTHLFTCCRDGFIRKKMSSNADFGLVPRIINASIAGIVGVTCVFPLDLAKTRWQNTSASIDGRRLYNSYLDCFVKTLRNEGIRGMYKGSSVNLLLITPEKAIKLVANDSFRYLLKSKDGSLPVYKQVIAGASAGMCQIVITTPMELLKIALQDSGRVAAMSGSNSNGPAPTATQIAMKVFKQKGITGFYQGGTATLARDVFFSAMYFPLFAYFNAMGKPDPETNKPAFYHTFASGIVAGSIAAYVATPLDVVKTRIQTTTKAPGELQYNGVVDSFIKILKHESPSALFKGAVARVCVVAPLFGIAQMFYYLGVAEALLGYKSLTQI
ncbi:unnamed protein product [Brachionus calyciflorus]|uniref:Mitochondrial glutamate carrier 2 n=1 Tax=Brachionus calyciflorus TaxID=104777 RepID=A0A813TUG0_9BILA|nr:unnamed protein product [Brachionus calyciflorus]